MNTASSSSPLDPRRLVVRPAPYTGESLASYAGRLAAANHISITELMGDYYAPVKFRYGDPEVVNRLRDLTGLPAERLQQMAHPVMAGGTGSRKGYLGIRTRGQVICHNCHGEDGIRLLEWDHPLITVCFYCHGLLAPLDASPKRTVPSRWLLNDLLEVREIVKHAGDPDWREAWARVETLCRMGRLLARGVSSAWPGSRYPYVRAASRRAAAELKLYPSRREVTSPPSLDLALVTIATCWDNTLDPDEAERYMRTRIRQARNNERSRLRRIEKGRAEVAAYIARSAPRVPARPSEPWPWE